MRKAIHISTIVLTLALSAGASAQGFAGAQSGRIPKAASPEQVLGRMDADGNGTISREEFKGSDEAFGRMDKDENGVLTREELHTPWNRGPDPREVLRRMDKDENGTISREEFKGSDKAFGRMDTDENGVLTREELWSAWFQGPSSEGILKGMDADKNGTISREEFKGSDEAFGRLDKDGNGAISKDELESARASSRRHGGERSEKEECSKQKERPEKEERSEQEEQPKGAKPRKK